ncbi:GNAT family N-acetyltransferase [Nonomuraea sp. SYSU D8015]|uniref:GNAT family N-acetyltransferase n=1 Tax=Nonomuraea sp. SYSU D8015 TaxID=2593644 RepID=UPI0016617706|nr:GNAT family N-acetyltransferase [Nonomuraea sp. SYSU D8015]
MSVPLLTHLEVVPRRRNMGIGSELLDVVRQRLSAAGHRQVALGVGLDNDDAQRLYKRHGYVEWPHGMVKTTAVIYLSDGRRQFLPELCRIMVKPLDGDDSAHG